MPKRPQEQGRPRAPVRDEYRKQIDASPSVQQAIRDMQDSLFKLRRDLSNEGIIVGPDDVEIDLQTAYESNKTLNTSVATPATLALEFWGGTYVTAPDRGTAQFPSVNNKLEVVSFHIMLPSKVDSVTIAASTFFGGDSFSIGIFNSSKVLTGATYKFAGAGAGRYTGTFAEVTLDTGLYWLGWTSSVNPTLSQSFLQATGFQNAVNNCQGEAGSTSSSNLPTAFTSISTSTMDRIPLVRFWHSSLA